MRNGSNNIPESMPNPKPNQEEPISELPIVTFDEISGHWVKEMIEDLASRGIITGYPDGSFHPNETINHMAIILIRAFKFEPIREGVSFLMYLQAILPMKPLCLCNKQELLMDQMENFIQINR